MAACWSRRTFLACSAGAVAALAGGAAAGTELVSHGVLPGKAVLDRLDGACSLPATRFTFPFGVAPTISGTFFSSKRDRLVDYSIGYPPHHQPGSELPLVVMACNPHPGDDPMGMLVDELIPLCQARGLGRPPRRIGAMGISMGGYGALLLAEKHPTLVSAVAAISPAIWTSYAQARAANAGAYASPAAFAANDAVTHAGSLTGVPVRVATGYGDPFYPGAQALAAALPSGSVVDFGKGCHDGSFFAAQEPASLRFLAANLA